jgi:hypothetical protein
MFLRQNIDTIQYFQAYIIFQEIQKDRAYSIIAVHVYASLSSNNDCFNKLIFTRIGNCD